MYEIKRTPYIGYDYMEIVVSGAEVSWYLDCYACFGWQMDGNLFVTDGRQPVALRMKRDRKIINKVELTRLQRHFEACVREIKILEQSKSGAAAALALSFGFVGLAFAAGSMFLAARRAMLQWLSVLLALPALACMALAYPIYSRLSKARSMEVEPLIEIKRDEIYEICKKGHSLL